MCKRTGAYGESSSSTRSLVSMAHGPAISTAAKMAKTYWMPKCAMVKPTTSGPAKEPSLSQERHRGEQEGGDVPAFVTDLVDEQRTVDGRDHAVRHDVGAEPHA